MPTEILLALWFIILAFNAALLWAWYRLSSLGRASPPQTGSLGDGETPTVLLETLEHAPTQLHLHTSHIDTGHIDKTHEALRQLAIRIGNCVLPPVREVTMKERL